MVICEVWWGDGWSYFDEFASVADSGWSHLKWGENLSDPPSLHFMSRSDLMNNLRVQQQMEKEEEEKDRQGQLPLECTEDGVCRVRPKSGQDAGEEELSVSLPLDAKQSTRDDNDKVGTVTTDDRDKEAKQPKPKKNSSAAASQGAVRTLHSQADLNALLASSNDSTTTVIVEFITTWCGACKSIATQWQDLAAEHDDGQLVCATIVCDKNKTTQKLAAEFGVKSYPVFIVWHQGQQVQKWNGADIGKLVKAFEKYGAAGGGGKKGKGRGGGGKKKGRR